MKPMDSNAGYGSVTEPATLTIQRLLPGPIERVWAYLTESDLRREWLASGNMKLEAGAPFELVWRNDELSNPPSQRPEGFSPEMRMKSEVLEVAPPHRLVISWGRSGGVSFELEERGDRVLLTLTHRRLPDRGEMLNVSAGWHIHLDILAARMQGKEAMPFWPGWAKFKRDYEARIPV